DFAIAQGLKWLDDYSRNYKQDDSEAVGARAYAYYVLATAKSGDISGLRYLHDNYLRRMPSGLAAAQLGAALALRGDQQRAAEAFKVAERRTVVAHPAPLALDPRQRNLERFRGTLLIAASGAGC